MRKVTPGLQAKRTRLQPRCGPLDLSNLIPVAVEAAVGVVTFELWKWGRREQSKKVLSGRPVYCNHRLLVIIIYVVIKSQFDRPKLFEE